MALAAVLSIRPDLAEHEGEQDGEHHPELLDDRIADFVVAAQHIEMHEAARQPGEKTREPARTEFRSRPVQDSSKFAISPPAIAQSCRAIPYCAGNRNKEHGMPIAPRRPHKSWYRQFWYTDRSPRDTLVDRTLIFAIVASRAGGQMLLLPLAPCGRC